MLLLRLLVLQLFQFVQSALVAQALDNTSKLVHRRKNPLNIILFELFKIRQLEEGGIYIYIKANQASHDHFVFILETCDDRKNSKVFVNLNPWNVIIFELFSFR